MPPDAWARQRGMPGLSPRAGPGLPVGGVSWFEAAAYCAFRGEQLPTVYHWARAALPPREVTAPIGPLDRAAQQLRGPGSGAGRQVRRAWARMAPTTWPATCASGPGTRRRSVAASSSAAPGRSRLHVQRAVSLLAGRSIAGKRIPLHAIPGAGEAGADRRRRAAARASRVSRFRLPDAKPVSDEVFDVFAKQLAYVPVRQHRAGRGPRNDVDRLDSRADDDRRGLRRRAHACVCVPAARLGASVSGSRVFSRAERLSVEGVEHDVPSGRLRREERPGACAPGLQRIVRAMGSALGLQERTTCGRCASGSSNGARTSGARWTTSRHAATST